MISPRLPLVNTQRLYLSEIRLRRQLPGPKVKATYKKKLVVRNSLGFSFDVRKIPFNVVRSCLCLCIDSIFTWIVTSDLLEYIVLWVLALR